MTPREILVRRVTAVVFLALDLPLLLLNAWCVAWGLTGPDPWYFMIAAHLLAATILVYGVAGWVESLVRLRRISRLMKKLAMLEARSRQIETTARYRAITNMYRWRN